jgi:hypothetical protein
MNAFGFTYFSAASITEIYVIQYQGRASSGCSEADERPIGEEAIVYPQVLLIEICTIGEYYPACDLIQVDVDMVIPRTGEGDGSVVDDDGSFGEIFFSHVIASRDVSKDDFSDVYIVECCMELLNCCDMDL